MVFRLPITASYLVEYASWGLIKNPKKCGYEANGLEQLRSQSSFGWVTLRSFCIDRSGWRSCLHHTGLH